MAQKYKATALTEGVNSEKPFTPAAEPQTQGLRVGEPLPVPPHSMSAQSRGASVDPTISQRRKERLEREARWAAATGDLPKSKREGRPNATRNPQREGDVYASVLNQTSDQTRDHTSADRRGLRNYPAAGPRGGASGNGRGGYVARGTPRGGSRGGANPTRGNSRGGRGRGGYATRGSSTGGRSLPFGSVSISLHRSGPGENVVGASEENLEEIAEKGIIPEKTEHTTVEFTLTRLGDLFGDTDAARLDVIIDGAPGQLMDRAQLIRERFGGDYSRFAPLGAASTIPHHKLGPIRHAQLALSRSKDVTIGQRNLALEIVKTSAGEQTTQVARA